MTAGIWFWILYVISLLFGGGWYWRTPAAQPFGPYAGRWSRGPSSVVPWSGGPAVVRSCAIAASISARRRCSNGSNSAMMLAGGRASPVPHRRTVRRLTRSASASG